MVLTGGQSQHQRPAPRSTPIADLIRECPDGRITTNLPASITRKSEYAAVRAGEHAGLPYEKEDTARSHSVSRDKASAKDGEDWCRRPRNNHVRHAAQVHPREEWVRLRTLPRRSDTDSSSGMDVPKQIAGN
jgi:hypothetical protein